MILLFTAIILAILAIISAFKKYRKIKEQYNLYEPEIDYQYFRDIPQDLDPIFASELVFMKDPFNPNKEKQEEYAAILLSLVRKQYVKIDKFNSTDWNKHNTILSIEPLYTISATPTPLDSPNATLYPTYKTVNQNTGDILEPLTTSERLYLELLARYATNYTSNSIRLSSFQACIESNYERTNAFIKDIEKKPILENGIMKGYFQGVNYNQPQKSLNDSAKISLTLGVILLFVNLISYFTPMALAFGAYTILGIALIWKYFYLTLKASNAVLFTQYGINEQAKWVGLYNFLNSDTLINEKEVHDLVLWEKYLIYATAFGISEKVVKAIKIHAVHLDIDKSYVLNRKSYIHSSSYRSTSRSFGRSMHTSSRGGGFGGSGFGGHGYGGGGRGGGGGGGGH